MLIILVHPCLFLSGPLSLCLRSFFLSFRCDELCPPCAVLSRDRRCDNNHRHHIDSWWLSYGFYVFTKSYDSMEISGEDDQTNSAGARPTGRDLQQQQEWWTRKHLLMIRRKSKTGGIKHTCQVVKLESRSGVSKGPHLLFRGSPRVIRSTFSSDADAAHEYSWSLWRTFGSGIGGMMINNGNGCKFNPETVLIHGTSTGLWFLALDINRITVGINGIAGMPMIGVNGRLGLHVAMMMMGGRRGHSGTVNRRSTPTRARLQSGTEIILRKPGATIVAH